MKKDNIKIVVTIPEDGVQSINLAHYKIAFFTLIGLTIISLSCFLFMYKYYKKARVQTKQKKELIDQLSVLKRDLGTNEVIEDILRERLETIEEKLLEMQKLLDKKGIKNELSVGGEFIPADKTSLSYMNFMEKDIDELFDTMKSFPLGAPLLGKVNSRFGYRRDPLNSRSAFHSGVDIDAVNGEPVIATADGTVKYADWRGGYGKTVIIKHKYGYETLYGHLSKIGVKKDQTVKVGDRIGFAGSTGRATGPHLHYEVIKSGAKVNPSRYLSLQ